MATGLLALLAACQLPGSAAQTVRYTSLADITYGPGTTYSVGPGPEGKRQGPGEEHLSRTLKVSLSKQWFAIEGDHSIELYDFGAKRIISIDKAAAEYAITDLYGMVYFFIMESQNRSMLNEVLKAGGTKLKDNSEFGIESMFSLAFPDAKSPALVETSTGGTTRFKVDGKEIVAWTPSQQSVQPECQRSYERFLTYYGHMHPKIRQVVAADPHFFEKLHLKSFNNPVAADQYLTMTLEQVEKSDGDSMPSIDGLKLARDARLAPVYEAVEKVGPNPQFPSWLESLAVAEKLAQEGHTLDAILQVLEYGLATGDKKASVDGLKEFRDKAQSDPQCKLFFERTGASDKEAAEKALKKFALIDRTKLSKGNVVDIMEADTYGMMGRPDKAAELLVEAIKKNPLVVGAYVDLGSALSGQYQMAQAWAVYSLARKLRPQHPMLEAVKEMELRMEHDFPDFF